MPLGCVFSAPVSSCLVNGGATPACSTLDVAIELDALLTRACVSKAGAEASIIGSSDDKAELE